MEWLDPLALARWQFGLTTLYHFLFVPLTLGMSLAVAIFQTVWYRTGTCGGCTSRASSGRSS